MIRGSLPGPGPSLRSAAPTNPVESPTVISLLPGTGFQRQEVETGLHLFADGSPNNLDSFGRQQADGSCLLMPIESPMAPTLFHLPLLTQSKRSHDVLSEES